MNPFDSIRRGRVPAVIALLTALAAGHFPSARADSGIRRSIHDWTACTGTTDDTAGATRAFADARHGAFTLVVDCPVRIHVGSDIARSIFIDDGTTIEFSGAGKITVDNVFIPAFVIADSSDITLTDWDLEYDGGLPMDQNTGEYLNGGTHVAGAKPANAFNDLRLTRWLADNRGVVFDRREGSVNSQWTGTTNACAVFFITGDSSKIRVTGMKMHVPASAGGERFIPVAFTFGINFRRNQTVTSKMPLTAATYAVPHDITFAHIVLDGTYMGWVGGIQQATFDDVRSERYGDLQDAAGGTGGGLKKWFAPPHLFYFSYTVDGDPGLFNRDITIRNVVDHGIRVGTARDKGGQDNISGNALSLKIGCVDCRVENYSSDRPDGFMDVLSSDGLTVDNAHASFNSAFINNLYPGLRFPSPSYRRVTLENIVLIDTAESTMQGPIGNANQPGNQGIVMKNVRVELNHWGGNGRWPLPTITGPASDVSLEYRIKGDAIRIVRSHHGNLEITLQAARMQGGGGANLSWTTGNALHCSAGGAWSGPLPTSGSRALAAASGIYSLSCESASDSATTTLDLRESAAD